MNKYVENTFLYMMYGLGIVGVTLLFPFIVIGFIAALLYDSITEGEWSRAMDFVWGRVRRLGYVMQTLPVKTRKLFGGR